MLCLVGVSLQIPATNAFVTTQSPVHGRRQGVHVVRLSDNSNNQDEISRLRQLGFSEDEIRRSNKGSDPEEIKVRVDLVDDVDPVTLTAIGFALIAFNFLVFANMNDAGIAGLVARIMNSF